MKLTTMLQQLYLEELDSVPASDARRTAQCLMHGEIQAVALEQGEATATQLAHLIECSVCRKNWQSFVNLSRFPQENAAVLPAIEPSPPLWTPEFSAHVSRILASASYLIQESTSSAPAHFDNEGTLRVHWSGLREEGPVSVSLLIDERPFLLASGIVRDGFLDIVAPLAELGQRNIELPAGLLVLSAAR